MRRLVSRMWTLGPLASVCALVVAGTAAGREIIPLTQDRSTDAFVIVPHCGGDAFDGEAAVGFEPFDSLVHVQIDCALALGRADASQQSQLNAASISAGGVVDSEATAGIVNVIHAIGSSFFEVTFQLSSDSDYTLDGLISAETSSDPAVLAGAEIRLTGPGGETIFAHLVEPGPGGEPNSQVIEEGGVLASGVYTLRAQANSVIDNEVPPNRAAAASFDLTLELGVPCPADITGDGVVNVLDLIELLLCFGQPAVPPCDGADINDDGVVNVLDLIELLLEFGTECP